jgi:calcineurin-like phosphoesterase family protein
MIFFTSDSHFGHARIIPLCKRPFTDVTAMDEAMVRRWNEVVARDDEVWHLGDFSAYGDGRAEGVFWRLNGRKSLIVGNHDEENDIVMALPWERVDKHALVHVNGEPVFLCHYPMMSWPKITKGAIHLYGHMHGRFAGTRSAADMGVDVWDFRPQPLDAIKRRLKSSRPMTIAAPEVEDEE